MSSEICNRWLSGGVAGAVGALAVVFCLAMVPGSDPVRPVIPEGFAPLRPGYVTLHRDTFTEIRDAARADGYRNALAEVHRLLANLPVGTLTNAAALSAVIDFELWPEGVGR